MPHKVSKLTEDCTICCEKLLDAEYGNATNCKHFYHIHCMIKWYNQTNNELYVCPLCRKSSTSFNKYNIDGLKSEEAFIIHKTTSDELRNSDIDAEFDLLYSTMFHNNNNDNIDDYEHSNLSSSSSLVENFWDVVNIFNDSFNVSFNNILNIRPSSENEIVVMNNFDAFDAFIQSL